MKFLADMGVSARVVEWLRQAGHDAIHLSEISLPRLADKLVFKKAMAESRTLLTFDLDFGEIVALSSGHPVAVILFRLNNTDTSFVIQRLQAVLIAGGEILRQGIGAIIVVEDARLRIRRLPFA